MFVDAIKQFRREVLKPRHDYGHERCSRNLIAEKRRKEKRIGVWWCSERIIHGAML